MSFGDEVFFTVSFASNDNIELYDYLKINFEERKYRYLNGISGWVEDSYDDLGNTLCAEYISRTAFDILLKEVQGKKFKEL